MALNINGTTGISGVDGSASAPALQGTDSNTGINFASDTVNINTGGTTRATVDSNGRLGIGTTSPDDVLAVRGSNGGGIRVSDSTANMLIGTGSGPVGRLFTITNHDLIFGANDTERMRLRTSTGGLMIGETGSTRIGEPKLHVLNGGASNNVASFFFNTTDDRDVMILRHNGADGGNNRVMIGLANADGNKVGNIISNGSSTSYNTSSDYRLKENEVLISDGITRLKTLKPYRFNWKTDPSTTVDGFFAHEVTAVPEAVTGEKDGEEMQAIDQSKLVPLLTAALQEAVGKIETLETKVAALEAA